MNVNCYIYKENKILSSVWKLSIVSYSHFSHIHMKIMNNKARKAIVNPRWNYNDGSNKLWPPCK